MADVKETPSAELARDDHTARLLLEVFEVAAGWSMGCVTRPGQVLRLPRACLERCLDGRAENVATGGCAWLQARVARIPCQVNDLRIVCAQGQVAQVHAQGASTAQTTVFSVCPPDVLPAASAQELPTALAANATQHLKNIADIAETLVRREEENVRLAEEVLQCYEQLNILYEITRAFTAVPGVNELYRIALTRIGAILKVDVSFLFNERGELASVYEAEAENGRIDRRAWIRALTGPGRKVIERVLAERAAQAVQEQGEHHVDGLPGPLLLIPLVASEKVMGVAGFGRQRNPAPLTIGEQAMAEAVLGHAALNVQVYRLFDDLQQMSMEVVRALVNAIDAKDVYTGGHSERVARWSRLLAERLGLAGEDLQMLEWGARLHDIGKIGTRENVLGKPGKLTSEEFEHIKEHPVTSFEVLRPIQRLAPVLPGVLHHHECWDGSGYPAGLAGEDIPLFARVIQTADVFDALTSNRSYRKAYTVAQALEIMRDDAGTRLDPRLVETFTEIVRELQEQRPELLAHIPPEQNAAGSPGLLVGARK